MPKEELPGIKGGGHEYDTRSGSATLRGSEIQDLSDAIAELTTIAVGHDLRFFVRIELSGEKAPAEEVVNAVNRVLGRVSPNLKLD